MLRIQNFVFLLLIHNLGSSVIQNTNCASSAIIINRPADCGYETCKKVDKEKLNIHLVPHSHDDVGWLKTVDQYYFGTRPSIQLAGVQYIIDSYVKALEENPERRFIQVETAYFWKWWKLQNEKKREQVRKLVDSGRLEFIGGGWSMADEGATHYHSLIDQYTWGFRKLEDTLGPCARPKIAWQIDPFGHSREQAAMFAQLGFDGYFLARLHYNDKKSRLENKTAEFIWKANPSLGSSADIFTSITYNNYAPPPGFCFDILCTDDPIVDDVFSPEYNVPQKVEAFLNYSLNQSRSYRTNNVLMTMGEDFFYQDAQMNFNNLDKLIRYANERNGSNFNLFYSTPSCYMMALHEEKLKWSVKTDDFFPYASDAHSFWTGYFTSRPTLKYFERLGNNFLQVVKQMATVDHKTDTDQYLDEFREAMGIMQHHDAVTGTEKQHVADDYARILYKAVFKSQSILENSLRKLTSKNGIHSDFNFESCLLLNISSCPTTENNDNFVVTIYNPVGHETEINVRIPVTENSYFVEDFAGARVVSQIVPVMKQVEKIPGRFSAATHELLFVADGIPALGFKSYFISKQKTTRADSTFRKIDKKPFTLDVPRQNIKLHLDENNRMNIELQKDQREVWSPSVMFYEAAAGNNRVPENRSSGAYIFRPNVTHPIHFNTSVSQAYFVEGPIVTELHLEINDWITQVVRVYSNTDFVEYNWIVGPIPIDDGKGKEIIVRYNSTIESNGIFYTDSNGRQILKRVRKLDGLEEPIAGNYYPVSNKIYLQNEQTHSRLAILTDRNQGGSSLNDGQLELMVHRRLLKDDAFGVGEALNESAFGEGLVATGKHYIHLGNIKTDANFIENEKLQTVEIALRPWLTFTPLKNMSFNEYRNKYNMQYSILRKPLPKNINIITLEPWKDNTILLRFEHLFEVGEGDEMSKSTEFNVKDLFATFNIAKITEMTLGANLELSELNRFKWSAETETVLDFESEQITVTNDSINIVMKPSEIRTFIAQID